MPGLSDPRGTNPAQVIEAAKHKARQCLADSNPRLTALEKAFWIKYKHAIHNSN